MNFLLGRISPTLSRALSPPVATLVAIPSTSILGWLTLDADGTVVICGRLDLDGRVLCVLVLPRVSVYLVGPDLSTGRPAP
jgi:hypothetical protein